MSFVRGSNSALSSSNFFFSSSSSISNPYFVVDFNFFPSNSFNCCTAYSSMGSTMYKTSRPFFLSASKKGDEDTAAQHTHRWGRPCIKPLGPSSSALLRREMKTQLQYSPRLCNICHSAPLSCDQHIL